MVKSQWSMAVAVALVGAGCVGASQTRLRQPVADQCVLAGLSRCNEIAASAVHFARGNSTAATAALARGLSANLDQPAELMRFAAAMDAAGGRRSARQFVAQLKLAVALLQQRTARTEHGHSRQMSAVVPPPPSEFATPTGPTTPERDAVAAAYAPPAAAPRALMQSRLVIVPGHKHASPCDFPGFGRMACVRQPLDSVVVTDVLVSSGCNHSVVVAAATHGGTPTWAVVAPAGRGVSLHGARLPIAGPQVLTYGIAAAAQQGPPDMRCAVTIAWEPNAPVDPEAPPLPVSFNGGGHAQWAHPIVLTNPYRREPAPAQPTMGASPGSLEPQPGEPIIITNPYSPGPPPGQPIIITNPYGIERASAQPTTGTSSRSFEAHPGLPIIITNPYR